MRLKPNRLIIVFAFPLFLASCKSYSTQKERFILYNDVLEQIAEENYASCFTADMPGDEILGEFQDHKINESTYFRKIDSLKVVRKSISPKCVLEYSNEIGIINENRKIEGDLLASMSRSLENDFVKTNFVGIEIHNILDSVSISSKVSTDSLKVSFLQIAPYRKDKTRPWGVGMGIIGLSKIYFSKNGSNAIVYYEFNCGPKCGIGEVLFVSKESDRWVVKKRKPVWKA